MGAHRIYVLVLTFKKELNASLGQRIILHSIEKTPRKTGINRER